MPIDNNRRRPTLAPAQPDYKAMLAKSMQKAWDKKDDSGFIVKTIFKPESNLPMFRMKNNVWTFDAIPYIAGEMDPLGLTGEMVNYLDVWVHSNVGPAEASVVCLQKTFKERGDLGREYHRCAICEEEVKLLKTHDYNDEIVKEIRSKRRTIYNAIFRDNGEEEAKGIQIFDISHYQMERILLDLGKDPNSGAFIYYSLPGLEGMSIRFKRAGEKGKYTLDAHQFVPRPRNKPVTQEMLNAAYVLDEHMVLLTYEEIAEMFYSSWGKEAEKPEKTFSIPGQRAAAAPAPAEPDPNEDVSTGDDWEAAGDDNGGAAEGESSTSSVDECPAGGTIGVDFDKFKACEQCPQETFDHCYELNDTIKKEAEAAKAKPAAPTARPSKPGLRR